MPVTSRTQEAERKKVSLSSRLAWAMVWDSVSKNNNNNNNQSGKQMEERRRETCRQLILILPSCSSYCLRYKQLRNPSYGYIRVFSTSLRIKKHKHLQHWPRGCQSASLSFWASLVSVAGSPSWSWWSPLLWGDSMKANEAAWGSGRQKGPTPF